MVERIKHIGRGCGRAVMFLAYVYSSFTRAFLGNTFDSSNVLHYEPRGSVKLPLKITI